MPCVCPYSLCLPLPPTCPSSASVSAPSSCQLKQGTLQPDKQGLSFPASAYPSSSSRYPEQFSKMDSILSFPAQNSSVAPYDLGGKEAPWPSSTFSSFSKVKLNLMALSTHCWAMPPCVCPFHSSALLHKQKVLQSKKKKIQKIFKSNSLR